MFLSRSNRRPSRPVPGRTGAVSAKSAKPTLEYLEDRCLPAADMVVVWNNVALDAIRRDYTPGQVMDQGGPTMDSRALAIFHVAIADAVANMTGAYAPYLVHLHARHGASLQAAVAAAAHETLAALYPHQKALIDGALATTLTSLAGHTPARDMTLGVQFGNLVADQILANRQDDGSHLMPPYTPGTQPGQWQPDPTHPQQMALGVDWGNVKPFVLHSGMQFLAPPPPAMTSPEYTAAFNEVKALGGDGVHTPTQRTPEQTMIGMFWAYDGTVGMGTPPVHYNEIVQMLAHQQHNSEVQDARLFALVNVAMADTAITVWDTKYTYSFWRPVTAMRAAGSDGNPQTNADANWTPLGAPADNGGGTNFTPGFPSYTSGHAGFGAALFRVLRDFYGTDRIHFTIGSDELNGVTRDQNGNVRPVVFRHYTSFSQAALENAISRIYLGIHWRFDAVAGMNQGTQVGDWVFQRAFRSQD